MTDSLNTSVKSMDLHRNHEKKNFQSILKTLDSKIKKARFKFINTPMEYLNYRSI